MNVDHEFYKFQTKIRGIQSEEEVASLCFKEANRLGSILKSSLNKVQSNPYAMALDAPCGYGNMLYLYKNLGIKSVGFDLDESQISLAKKLGLNAHVLNIYELPLDQKYSIISSLDFIEHVEIGNALIILRNFYKLLNDNGVLLIRTPCGDSPFGFRDFAGDLTHKWFGTCSSVTALLEIAGFKKIEIIEDWPIPSRYVFIRKLLAPISRLFIRIMIQLAGYGDAKCISSSMILVAYK